MLDDQTISFTFSSPTISNLSSIVSSAAVSNRWADQTWSVAPSTITGTWTSPTGDMSFELQDITFYNSTGEIESTTFKNGSTIQFGKKEDVLVENEDDDIEVTDEEFEDILNSI